MKPKKAVNGSDFSGSVLHSCACAAVILSIRLDQARGLGHVPACITWHHTSLGILGINRCNGLFDLRTARITQDSFSLSVSFLVLFHVISIYLAVPKYTAKWTYLLKIRLFQFSITSHFSLSFERRLGRTNIHCGPKNFGLLTFVHCSWAPQGGSKLQTADFCLKFSLVALRSFFV